ncbi:MAG: MFS transporter [Candidatus Bathyarchaeota archaeon]|nr:MFS transporter [Candidatus Bathyarchaeota archaeon]MDH5495148.1 MFS transporter [Candidatus Bathyarchaeota archaeon]
MDNPASYRWKTLALAYVCMLSFALVFQSIPPLLTLICQEFGISHAHAGLLMSLFALPGIFVALPGGIISDRFGMKKTGITSLVLMIAGTLIVGTSITPLQAYVGRIVSGIGGLTLAIVLPQLVSKWFLGKELGVGMGVFNTAMPLGTILSFNVFSVIGNDLGWQVPIFLTTTASIFALLLFLWLFKKPTEKSENAKSSIFRGITKLGASIWLVGFSWMWFNAAFISFLTFSHDFFVAKGHEVGSAGFMSSVIIMGSLFLSPLIGYLVSKFRREEMFIGLSGVILAFLLFSIPTALHILPLLVLIGIFAALVPVSIFSLPSKIVKPKNLGLAFGIITACLNIGVLVGPFLAGLAKDFTGEYNFSFYLLSLFAVLQTVTIGFFSLFRLKNEKKAQLHKK